MTPKEKAEELFSKYYNSIEHTLSEEYSPHEMFVVKECTLIAVDEIIKSNPIFVTSKLEGKDGMHEAYLYWKEVKEELENL